MEMCDWCGQERAHGKVLTRNFGSYQDTSWSVGWDCFAKFHSLRQQIGAISSGHFPPPEEERTEEDIQEEQEARRRAFPGPGTDAAVLGAGG